MNQNMPSGRRRIYLIAAAVILLIAAVILVYFLLSAKAENDRRQVGQIHPDIQAAVEKYMVGLLGESEFRKSYAVKSEKIEYCADNIGDCFVYYTFLPAEKYEGSEYMIVYFGVGGNISTPTVQTGNMSFPLPACEKDVNKCQFSLTRSDLQAIARRENLSDDSFRLVMYQNEIVAEVSHCDVETMANRRKILVDLVTGDILWDGENQECQFIA